LPPCGCIVHADLCNSEGRGFLQIPEATRCDGKMIEHDDRDEEQTTVGGSIKN
jgi:hypothetical protein